jgi:hypothetical protein
MNAKFALPVILIMLLVGGSRPATAQPADDSWRVTVFDRVTGQIHYLTPDGIESGPAAPLPEGLSIWDASLSPDEHYLVFRSDQDVWVADLVAGTCCTPLLPSDPTYFPTYISPISPDSTKVAVSMSTKAIYTAQPGEVDLPVMVFDLASGQLVAALSSRQLQAGEYPPSAFDFGEWRAVGLRIIPSWWGCEGTWEGVYQVWDPMAGTLSEPVEPYSIWMDDLPGTGEQLKAAASPAYPQSGFPSAYVSAANVVEYRASFDAADASVVYFNPNMVHISSVSWVAGGQAFLVVLGGEPHSSADNGLDISRDNESVLVFRDGHQVPVTMPGYSVLTGTPDGWIARSWETGEAAIVQVLPGDQLNIIPVNAGNSVDWQIVAVNFQLGASASVAPFPATYPPPTYVTCPGFMPSRLWPRTYAVVAAGGSGNLLSIPSSQGTPVITISEGTSFAVLDGPECAENTAWWHVEYYGAEGWLAEGQGDAYWLRPIGEGFY